MEPLISTKNTYICRLKVNVMDKMRLFKDKISLKQAMSGMGLLLMLLTFTSCDTSEPNEPERKAWDVWQADLYGQWVVDDYWGEITSEKYTLHVGEGKIANDTLVMRENNKLVLREAQTGEKHLLDGYYPKEYKGDYTQYNYYDYKVYRSVAVGDLSNQKSLPGADVVEFLPYTDKVSKLSFTIYDEDYLKNNPPVGYNLYNKADGYMYLYSGGLPAYRIKKISDKI